MRGEEPFFLFDCSSVADGELDDREVVGVLEAKVARRMHYFSLWPVLGDDLEEIVLRNFEGLDKRPMDTVRYGLSIFRRPVIRDSDADQWHWFISPSVKSSAPTQIVRSIKNDK
jgi:hypothetical protein